jgi:phosphoglucomutase
MKLHPLAGRHVPRDLLVDVDRLQQESYSRQPDCADSSQRVRFGTSGHRGSSLRGAFNETHILAITQAICEYRIGQDIIGPLFIGKDTHALSERAFRTAVEVLAANGVETVIDRSDGYTPTPAISHAILKHSRGRTSGAADGIVITPSHNPPEDGGFKYNPPTGGPADTNVTRWIEDRANRLLSSGLDRVARLTYERARQAATTHTHDYVGSYVNDLGSVVDMDVIRGARLEIGVDPLGGASVGFWAPIAERYGVDIQVVNDTVDPTFGFMSLDWDGRVRMDCSSPYAMAPLVGLKDRFDIAFGNDPDADRHGIVTHGGGLMNPNHVRHGSLSPASCAGRRPRHRVPVGRPGSPCGDDAPERDQSGRGTEALEAQLLLRARAAGRSARRLARTAGEPRSRTAGLQSSGEVRQCGCPRQVHDHHGNRIGRRMNSPRPAADQMNNQG